MNKTHIKVYGTDIEFTMQGNPTYREIIRYAIQNDIPIKPQPIFSITRPPDPTFWDQFKNNKSDLSDQDIKDLIFIVKEWRRINQLKEGNKIYKSLDKEFLNEWKNDRKQYYRYSRTYDRILGEVEWYKKTNNLLKILTNFKEKSNAKKSSNN